MRAALRVFSFVLLLVVLLGALFAYSEWRREVYYRYDYGPGGLAPMERTAIGLGHQLIFVAWLAAYLFSRRLPWTPGRKFLSAALFVMFFISAFRFVNGAWLANLGDLGVTVMPWLHLIAVGCFVVGFKRYGSAAVAAAGANGGSWMNRYYATHELISRAASVPTANEDLERIKNRWFAALQPFAAEAPERTSLRGNEPYSRTLVLERYVDMPAFEGGACGQLRTVQVGFSGPGSSEPWMTAVVTCEIDERPVASFPVRNVDVLRSREKPEELTEFRRIGTFLQRGRLPWFDDFMRRLENFGLGLVSMGLAVPVGAAALAFAPIKAFLGKGRRRARFVPTRAPEVLPSEQSGTPIKYWNALLPDLASKQEEVTAEVRRRFEGRAVAGIKVYEKDVIQWGGYQLKEVRRQLVIELRRAKAYVGVYGYGKDLYVRWDGHINRRTWLLRRFPYSSAVGYRFSRHLLSWAVPSFIEAPEVYEYAPTDSRVTDYDWADVDAIQDLAHEILTSTVRSLKERYHIEKEIDFEMKQGWRGGNESDGQDGEDAGRSAASKGGRKGRFVRQQ